ncbi:MAG: UPF0280 family protein [Candidatus Bathyarchaeota archaeon]|nr:UPF0280 family protein [Candidatus Bathyarchaeota archaeon]
MNKNLHKETFILKETQCTIISDKQEAIKIAKETIKHNRQELELYVRANPKFLHTLTPIPAPPKPLIAKLMAEAAQKAGVGPMAAVAGAIADLAVEDMVKTGCEVAVVEDGGEISAISNQPVDVAVAAGEEPLSKRFGFRLTEFPIGVATSSGRYSHALSFGDAEAAVVFCKGATLADAVATAVGNVVKGENVEEAIQAGMKTGLSVEGVDGILVIYRGQVGTAGKTPQMIKINHNQEYLIETQ